MMNPMITSGVAKAHREDLQREAHCEQHAAEALACDPRDEVERPRLVTRLIATAQVFLRVAGEAAPAEGQ